MNNLKISIGIFSLMQFQNIYAETLNLETFLKQIKENNEAYVASKIQTEAAIEKSDEHSLIFKPVFVSELQTAYDKKHTANIASQGNRTDYAYAKAGIQQQFDIGLKTNLNFKTSHTKLYNTSSSFVAMPDYKDNSVSLEFSQSLWRNFNGSESRAQSDLLKSSSEIQKLSEHLKQKQILSQAENVYWQLSQVQKLIKVQKESLDRALKIRTWAKNRFESQLGDKSDLLQADAGAKYRQLELESSKQEELSLTRTFNALRGMENFEQAVELEVVTSENVLALNAPTKAEHREDTLAAMENKKIATSNATLAIERYKPNFEVYGSYTLNGRDRDNYSDAVSDAFKNENETGAIGVRFSAPLDFFTTHKTISAYQKDITASDYLLKRKLYDENKEWNDLIKKLSDAKTRLKLALEIEEAQKIKASNERNRLNLGRTLTSTVLTFEQDLANSQIIRIKNENDIISTYTQLLTFKAGVN